MGNINYAICILVQFYFGGRTNTIMVFSKLFWQRLRPQIFLSSNDIESHFFKFMRFGFSGEL